ncbi:MAG: hypothetical protein U0L88_09495 [Acutalibacteraceae bacterium]|nr:hypothetical protein [Acutalibacteraceae bacterium]
MANSKYIEELIARDKAEPMGEYHWKTEKTKNDPPAKLCGKCDRVIDLAFTFCPWCGQRIDKNNYKL